MLIIDNYFSAKQVQREPLRVVPRLPPRTTTPRSFHSIFEESLSPYNSTCYDEFERGGTSLKRKIREEKSSIFMQAAKDKSLTKETRIGFLLSFLLAPPSGISRPLFQES